MSSQLLTLRDYFPDKRSTVRVRREVGQSPITRHQHEFEELVIVLSGEGLHNGNGHRHRIGRGDILFIDRTSFHSYEDTQGLNLVNLLIAREAVERMERDLQDLPAYRRLFGTASHGINKIVLKEPELAQVAEWIDLLERESSQGTGAGYLVAEAYLTLILALILRRLDRQSPTPPGDAFKGLFSWLEAHLAEPLTVAQMARRAGLSERQFYRHFQSATGMSPHAYRRAARLRKARDLLLKRSPLTCQEIARHCGFRDGNHFSSAFRRAFGQPPSAFRRQGG